MIEELTLPSGKKRSMFEARIPGQSLTEPEGKYPWDKPQCILILMMLWKCI